MAKVTHKTKENPKLMQRTLSDGRISLYLEYYFGRTQWVDEETGKEKIRHERKKEVLNLYLLNNARKEIDKRINKETLRLAQEIRFEREQELKNRTLGYRLEKKKMNFLVYYQNYIDRYTKKDIRTLKAALNEFVKFLSSEHPAYGGFVAPAMMTDDLIAEFVEYLQAKHKGEGARTYYMRFKKVVKAAYKDGMFKSFPGKHIVCRIDDKVLRKDVLSAEEVTKLISTHYRGENPEIRRAFIFTLYTGVRLVDSRQLTYRNIDYANRRLSFEQSKTAGRSSGSGVVIPLSDQLLKLIGNPPTEEDGTPLLDAKIFSLPSHVMLHKALKNWTARAGITKHVTWHCGRHTFATLILSGGSNIKTVASLLGHSGLEHTQKYVRAVDSLKEAAINSLPQLKFEP